MIRHADCGSGLKRKLENEHFDNHPAVSVIIISYNSLDEIARLIPSLIHIKTALSIELIVIDNCSTDGSRDLLGKFTENITLQMNDKNVGFARAVNQAAHLSHGKFLLLMNPDASITIESASMMITYLDEHPIVGAVGPRITNSDGSLQPSRGTFPNLVTSFAHIMAVKRFLPRDEWMQRYFGKLIGRVFQQYSLPCDEQIVDYTTGACALIRHDVFKLLSGLDENFFLYYEEIDFGFRMNQLGYQWVFLNCASASHSVAASSGCAPLQPFFERYRSMLFYFRKHKPKWQCKVIHFVIRLSAGVRLILIEITDRFRVDPAKEKAEEKAMLRALFGLNC